MDREPTERRATVYVTHEMYVMLHVSMRDQQQCLSMWLRDQLAHLGRHPDRIKIVNSLDPVCLDDEDSYVPIEVRTLIDKGLYGHLKAVAKIRCVRIGSMIRSVIQYVIDSLNKKQEKYGSE